jgi:hypothetical protein
VIRKALLGAVLLGATACSIAEPNLLGGREKCWSEGDPRNAALLEGRLDLAISSNSGTLITPDGTDFETEFPFMSVRESDDTVVLVHDGQIVAQSGETVTLFGGYGPDGVLLVCAIEERAAS